MTTRRNAAIYLGADLLNRVAILLIIPVWVAALSPEEFGIFDTLRWTSLMLGAAFGGGLAASLTRAAPVDAPETWANRYQTTWVTQLGLAACALALGELAGPSMLARWVPDATWSGSGRPTLWTAVVLAIFSVDLAILVYRRRAALSSLTQLSGTILALGLGTAGIVWVSPSAQWLLWGFLAAACVCVVSFWAAMRSERRGGRFDPELATGALIFGAPLVPHIVAQFSLVFIDRFVIIDQMSTAAAGAYGLAYVPASAVTIACMALNKAFTPVQYDALGSFSKEPDTSARTVHVVMNRWARIVIAGTFGSAVVAPWALALIKPDSYEVSSSVASWLCVGAGLHGTYLCAVNVLFFFGRTRSLAVMSLIAAGLNFGLNLWWIPQNGLMGAAVATTVAYGVLVAMVWGVALLVMKTRPDVRLATTLGLAATGPLALFLLAALPDWADTPARALIGAAYFGFAALVFSRAR
jgi:O-antigen/teichoic acid export membrane protein